MPPDVRKIALSVLNTLDRKRRTLDHIMEQTFAGQSGLIQRDRALLNALVFGTVRWRGYLDWVIAHYSKTSLNKIEAPVLNILRLGLFQVIFLDRIPLSAAVNTSAELAKSYGGRWVVGFVNALLRNAGRNHHNVVFPDSEKTPVAAMAARKAFPAWLIERWLERYGWQETGELCDAINTIPPVTIRANTLKTSRDVLQAALKNQVARVRTLAYAPDGLAFEAPQIPLADLQAFQDGWFQVQDEAAQLVALLLDPRPGDRVLDACAGLGGKTGHMAQLMQNQGLILAVDHQAGKLQRLSGEMQRLGISIVQTHSADLSLNRQSVDIGVFDRILLDAPCSGLGVMRRNPDIKWVLSKKNLKYYNKRQTKLLENLAPLVKPSGLIVYAVCSMEPEENEMVIQGFTRKHPEFKIVPRPFGENRAAEDLTDSNGYFKSLPHRDDMDGFFAVALKRNTDA
jgi:16S rRNA (cytosine967-C5)-methyltransferase